MVGTRAVSGWALGQRHDGHQGFTDLPEEPWPQRLAGRYRGSVARHRAPAVPRLAAPGTRRCPCVRLCQVPHACLSLVLRAHRTPVPVPGTPCPLPCRARRCGHVWQWGQRAVLWCAVPCREAAGIPGMRSSWAALSKGDARGLTSGQPTQCHGACSPHMRGLGCAVARDGWVRVRVLPVPQGSEKPPLIR